MNKEGLLYCSYKPDFRLPRKKKKFVKSTGNFDFKMCKQDWNYFYKYMSNVKK